MKRMSYDEYVKKCGAVAKKPLPKSVYDELDDEGYAKAVEGLGSEDASSDESTDDDDRFTEDEAVATGDAPESGEEDEELEESSKSMSLDEEDLLKSMELLAGLVKSVEDDGDRIQELHQKAADGTITKSEREELVQLLTESEPPATPITDEIEKSLSDDDEMAKAIDASDFLAGFSRAFVGGLQSLEKSLDEYLSFDRQYKRREAVALDALAKSLVAENEKLRGELAELKSVVAGLAGQPVAWRGVVRSEHVQKSLRDGVDVSVLSKASQISRRDAIDALTDLFEKSLAGGDNAKAEFYGNLVQAMEVTPGDWRRTHGLTPEVVEDIVKSASR